MTICSYDNSGQLKFDVDIEMEQGYWNTSSSRLWTRIRDLMHDDIVATYNNMRQNGVSYENMMHYIYDEQIAKIPQTYYNKDYDIKYAPFADSYIGMAHGDTYEHVKRWLKQRFTFVDTLFDYAPSYNNDVLTIRANTTELMTLEIETYTPVYQHLSWYNGQMDKKKIDGKISVEFSGTAQAATDQEVLIYGGSNVKSIKGITSMNPNRMLIGSATKLVEIDAHDCPLLADINANKANLSPHEYLNKVNLSNCPLLEGNLRLNNSPLVQEINIKGTKITGMNLPSSIRNLQVLRLPNTMTDLTLNDANMLHTLEFDEGVNLQSISMTNCNALENVINFDLLQTPSITLNNSYNTVAELYFRDTTNLSLSNMTNLERVIFTPNNEYETFEMINVANAPDYKVTTFNCPKLSTFMTTAPYRESYNDCDEIQETKYIKDYNNLVDILIDKTPLNAIVDTSTGVVSSSASGIHFTSQDYIEVMGDTEYTINITNGTSARLNLAFYDNSLKYIKGAEQTISWSSYTFTTPSNCCYIRYHIHGSSSNFQTSELLSPSIIEEIVYKKDYGDIQPNTTFTANSIDISSTQFTDVKLLCTTDTNTLKLPTTIKNFYCDSSFDLDTDYLEDGEYDVVHGELVEPYTTDYEGEVCLAEFVCEPVVWNTGNFNTIYPSISWGDSYSEKIYIEEGSIYTVSGDGGSNPGAWFKAFGFNNSDAVIWQRGGSSTEDTTGHTGTIPSGVIYIRFARIGGKGVEITYTKPYTPNLIPSSPDGSLIFSMYAPSNTVAPASGTWDLKGLEFDNFHTYGMNNDVKPSEDSYVKVADVTNMKVFTGGSGRDMQYGNIYYDVGQKDTRCITNIKLPAGYYVIKRSDGGAPTVYISTTPDGTQSVAYNMNNGRTFDTDIYITMGLNKDYFPVTINDVQYRIEDMELVDTLSILRETTGLDNGFIMASDYGSTMYTHGDDIFEELGVLKSLSMPARYDDYNITIKNANISPKTHNTMLYPLLVNEDNPIEGKLDYTNYEGNNLSWSFAYTDEEYVDIIQPKDELINSYEYKYNAFYDTEYEFDNPYEIAKYTSSASGLLPTFNSEFTYTYDEIDNEDGTYTIKVYADSLDILPTWLSYQNKTNLLSVEKLKTGVLVSAEAMFQGCSSLTSVNVSQMDVSNVGQIYRMFYGCNKLTEIQGIDNLSNGNFTNLWEMFLGCGSLTELDLSGFNTSNVTSMSGMFSGCNNLTSLDVSGFNTSKVTDMDSMFKNCSGLTSLDVSGFDTSNVIYMTSMFQNCSKLTSLNVSNFDTSKVTKITSMFNGCEKLTEITGLNNWDTSQLTHMSETFNQCYELKSLQGIENWNVEKLQTLYWTFRGCKKITSLDLSNWNITSALDNIGYAFMLCESLEYLDLSNWDVSNVTSYAACFSFGTPNKIKRVSLNGWTKDKIELVIPILPTKTETSTVQGTVIIDESTLPSGWVYNNVLEVAIYTANTSGLLPNFNTEFTYTHAEVDNGDGTYTTKVVADSIDNLPTKCSFEYKTSLLRVDKLNTSELTTMYYMFQNCSFLTYINSSSWDTSNVTDMCRTFNGCANLTELDVSGWDTSKVTTFDQMFRDCNKLATLDVSNWNTKSATNMSSMFANCTSLTSVNTTGWDTSQITNIDKIFQDCRVITHIDGLDTWDISSITDFSYMFANCYALSDLTAVENWDMSNAKILDSMFARCNAIESFNLTKWDVSNVTNMRYMFGWARGPVSIDMTGWDTSNVTNMYYMFGFCNKLTEIKGLENFNTANVTNMQYMLTEYQATELDLSGWDVSSVTNMFGLFEGCFNLQSLNISGWDTSNVTNMSNIFTNCSSLTTINGLSDLNTSSVTGMENMFFNCKNLQTIDMTKWDTSKVTNIYCMFRDCKSLTSLDMSRFTNCNNMGSFCRGCNNLVTIIGLDISKYSTNFGGNDMKFLSFKGCTSLRNIKDINVSFTSAMATYYDNTVKDGYWILAGWAWFNGLTNLVDITFTGQLELYDTMSTYMIFRGCDTTKFTYATWNTFVSIFPTTSTSKSIVMGSTQAILDAVPDEIKLALTQKGYTLTFEE